MHIMAICMHIAAMGCTNATQTSPDRLDDMADNAETSHLNPIDTKSR